MSDLDILVVGAGAAGLAAAIFAAETAAATHRTARIAILEGAATVGAKILISGGGRCNVTHDSVSADDFAGNRTFIRNVLAAFGAGDTVRWFTALGVELKCEETGKLFPISDRARTVLDALLQRCNDLGVGLYTSQRVDQVERRDDGFRIATTTGAFEIRRLILATGGRSLPRTGSDGSGWQIVRHLGHTVTPTYPALVPLVLHSDFFHSALSGVSHPAELSTFVDGKLADRRSGSLLWTHFGISGPVVLDASRYWVIAHTDGRQVDLQCNLFPGASYESIDERLRGAANERPRQSVARFLGTELPERLAELLVQHAGIAATTTLAQLPRAQRRQLVHTLTALKLPVERERGWDYAEVTAGGVPLQEVDFRTMASRRVDGLYLIGEMLDCDGRIGGFNFQWAWSTGYVAGRAAAAHTEREENNR
ncbi:MAG: NAD(P)/FAD-dependent oxidoreductase [Deltaproteobacteria bacterium]|nr:NAD(P)/FAD-dependent oxidoreductase [Deltaproteobacteria bacterium]